MIDDGDPHTHLVALVVRRRGRHAAPPRLAPGDRSLLLIPLLAVVVGRAACVGGQNRRQGTCRSMRVRGTPQAVADCAGCPYT